MVSLHSQVLFKLLTAEQKKSCLRESDRDADLANVLTMDEARHIASNIAQAADVFSSAAFP
jgi:hypothetical protein